MTAASRRPSRTTGRLREQLRAVGSWPRGRLWLEIGLALVVGVAAFVLVAAAGAAARSHVPAVLLGVLLLAAVLAVARFAGIMYSLPVGVVTILAFDWYFLPPLRGLDAGTALVLGLFLVMAVGVGAFTTHAGRRVTGSEQARGVLADEQAALRRVATLVARQPSPAEVFAAVTEEAGKLLHLDTAHLLVYERDGTATAVGAWGLRAAQLPVGTRVAVAGDNIILRVWQTQRPVRIDDYARAASPADQRARLAGVAAAVGTPVVAGGRLWGVMAIGSARPEPLPPGTEVRLGAFTDLVATAIANTQAREELEQVAAEQAALGRVATLVARHPSPAEVFAAVTEEAGKLLQLDRAHLLAYEGDGAVTVSGAWSLRGDPAAVGMRLRLAGNHLAGPAIRTKRPARIDDFTGAEGPGAEYARSLGVRAAVATPVLVEGRVWGVMTASSLRPEPLPAGTEFRLGAFTELVAMAIANAEARRELERVAAEQAALSRIATLVAEAVPPGEVFTAVAEEAAGLFGVPLVGLFRYETEGVATIIAGAGQGSPLVGRRWTFKAGDPSIVASLQRTGRPLRIDDYTQVEGAVTAEARELGITAAAGVPVIVNGRTWGSVELAMGHDHPPLPANALDRLAAFTDLMATAIANSDARTEIERLAEEQAALRRVATLVAQGKPTEEVFAAVAREVSEVMHLPVASVQRFEGDGETTTMIAARSDRPHPFQPGTSWPVHPAGLAARVRQTGRAGRTQDYSRQRGVFAAKAREMGLYSVAAAPIIVDGAVWGLIAIASTDGPIPDHAEDRLAEFTELMGTAIANTQSRAELSASRARIVAAADETRRRLERDLHDGIQQRLVSLALKARSIERMTPRPADTIQRELSLLAEGLGTSLDELREFSRGIHPAVLSEAGLGPALNALARRSAVPVNLDLNLGSRPGEHLEVAAYYVASEALANVAKHAQASVIDIRADDHGGALTLSIHDDGIGGADPSRGSGIIGLKDRVEALGGTISVLSPPGHGTTLHVQLPAGPGAAPTPQRAAVP
jgi:GAF domain-containing protein